MVYVLIYNKAWGWTFKISNFLNGKEGLGKEKGEKEKKSGEEEERREVEGRARRARVGRIVHPKKSLYKSVQKMFLRKCCVYLYCLSMADCYYNIEMD